MNRVLSVLCTLAVAAAFTGSPAQAEPYVGMPGKLVLVKSGKLAKFIAKPVTGDTFDLPTTANPVTDGGSILIREVGTSTELASDLPASGWKGLGNPAGSKGFKYKGAGSLTDPCKTVLVKEKIIKAICKGAAVAFDQPVDGVVAINLVLGDSTQKAYCTAFGGTEIKNDGTLLKRKDSTIAGACTCGNVPSRFTFKNGPPTTPNCGVMTTNTGATSNLACNGLYIGSGSASLVQPETNPDSEKALQMNISCCTGETLILTPTSQTDTGGDIETCTSAGCFFGAPLPLPNPSNPGVSTCVYNRYQADVQGEANCATGDARLDAPLFSKTFLTGDLLPNRCVGGTNPGARCGVGGTVCLGGGVCTANNSPTQIQSCPICNPVTLRCNGGANGMGTTNPLGPDADTPCTPDGGLNVPGNQFPTSHDCLVSTLVLVGDLPVPFLLTTGTSTDTATATGTLQRSFCGYCRDADGPGGFGICTGGTGNGMSCALSSPDCGGGTCGNAVPCEANSDCATDPASRESCEQRNNGAFGPGGGANMTITEVGTPGGDLGDQNGHPGTMVSVFCIPPSFNPIIDPNADIPGPGAVALPGTFDINSPSGAFVDGGSLF